MKSDVRIDLHQEKNSSIEPAQIRVYVDDELSAIITAKIKYINNRHCVILTKKRDK